MDFVKWSLYRGIAMERSAAWAVIIFKLAALCFFGVKYINLTLGFIVTFVAKLLSHIALYMIFVTYILLPTRDVAATP